MANELIKKEELVKVIQNDGVTSLIKPLVKEIDLFSTYISMPTENSSSLKAGDELLLRREKSRFDENAISILNQSKQKVGRVPEKDNYVFARLLEAGKLLSAKVEEVTSKRNFPLIRIKIYLVDF